MMRRGLTLIELLVAMIIAGIVSYMAWNLVRDEQTNYTRTRTKIKLQGEAREAIRIVEGEMRNLGFNSFLNTALGASRTSVSACGGSEDSRISAATGDSSSFLYVDSDSVPGGDEIEFRFHQSTPTGMTDCASPATPLQSISYRFNDGRLERRFCQGNAAATCATNGTWVPFLDSVVSFHIQYGLDADTVEEIHSTADLITDANWTTSGGLELDPEINGSDTTYTVSGFNNTRQWVRFRSAIPRYRRTDTYILSMRVVGNEAWRVDQLGFRLGMMQSDGSVDASTDTNRVAVSPPIPGSLGWTFESVLNPSTDADGQRYIGFDGQLVAAPTNTDHSVTIRNLSIRRISRGQYFRWVDAPSVAEKNRVRAARISMLVKSRRSDADPAPGTFTGEQLGEPGASYTPAGAEVGYSYILMQRIIPVVNNASL